MAGHPPIWAEPIPNPAPAAVYQRERYGAIVYTFPNLVSGASYNIRLHFAEICWTASGRRLFNVAINSSQVLSDFDIYAAAGGAQKAIVREFFATANSSDRIILAFTTITDNASICGIEILPSATPPVIITHPVSQSACDNSTVFLYIVPTRDPALSYQWKLDGVPLSDNEDYSGVNDGFLTISNFRSGLKGSYTCTITNSSSYSTESNPAVVSLQ